MKLIVLVCALVAVASCHPHRYEWDDMHDVDLNLEEEWAAFKLKYRKNGPIDNSGINRKAMFAENLKVIKNHNLLYAKGLKSYSLRVNEYADMTPEELGHLIKANKMEKTKGGSTFLSSMNIGELPKEVDWRKEGFVTPVKKQSLPGHRCGSCWAFSTVGAIEGQQFRKTGKLVELSAQELVDCSKKNHGCYGGLPSRAYSDIQEMGGIDTLESYPYVAEKHKVCNFTKENIGAQVTGFVALPEGNETALLEAVATVGPISVGVYFNIYMPLYHEGLYFDPACNSYPANHAMLVVGYGKHESGYDYWLVKNSWGTDWGMDGYIMIMRNYNACGIADIATYPTV